MPAYLCLQQVRRVEKASSASLIAQSKDRWTVATIDLDITLCIDRPYLLLDPLFVSSSWRPVFL